MDNVVVKSVAGVTKVEIKPFKMFIKFNKTDLEIAFEGADNNIIALRGNTKFLFEGDTYLISKGEFGIITNDKNIHLDSVDGQIHLNSRLSKPIKDLPESFEYRKKVFKEQEDGKIQVENQLENLTTKLTNTISDLEERIEELENDRMDN